jgi:hypothetical protein
MSCATGGTWAAARPGCGWAKGLFVTTWTRCARGLISARRLRVRSCTTDEKARVAARAGGFFRGRNDGLHPKANCRMRQLRFLPSLRSALRPCNAAVGDTDSTPGPARKLPCACRIQEGNDRGARLKCLRMETASRLTGSTATHNLSRFVPELRGSGTANRRGDPGSDILDGG